MGDPMSTIKKCIVLWVTLLLVANGAFSEVSADHDGHQEKRRYQKRYRNHSEHAGKHNLAPVNNPKYREYCGACHFAYQPELLPSVSWDNILAGLEDHFGETVDLDQDSRKEIAAYLKANAAEGSSAKPAVKIMRSLGGQTPLRITQIPYIRQKHHEIHPDVFKRESVGSLSNCLNCHTTADKGIYDDDHVVIPR